ncbi:MAG: MFS transporter, partial [Proteobacteria bacterium]|nr:MFS transporter [Pseudomonadota bacterium]
ALSIYSFGIPLGTMIGAVAGGWLATTFSWRMTFVIVGLPGLAIALLVRMLMREPPRGHADVVQSEHPGLAEDVTAHAAEPPAAGSWIGREFSELAAVAKVLFTKWPVVNMVLGVTIASFGSYGGGAFSSQFFYAGYHLSLAQVGLITGLVGGFSSGVGTLVGGFLSDRLSQRSPAWYSLTPAFGLAIATPIYIFAYMQPTMKLAAMVLLLPGIFHYTYLGPTFGVVQNMVETRRRATATALMFFFLNLIALGGGPPFIGWLIDQLADYNFAHGGGQGTLGSVLGLFGAHGADFQAQCPGGVAPKTAGHDLQSLCLATLANSSRQGVIVSIFFYAWASVHYFLGAIGLKRALAEARAERGEA